MQITRLLSTAGASYLDTGKNHPQDSFAGILQTEIARPVSAQPPQESGPLPDALAKDLKSRYPLDAMGSAEYQNLLCELQEHGVLTEQDVQNAHTRPMLFGCTVLTEEVQEIPAVDTRSPAVLSYVQQRNEEVREQVQYCTSGRYQLSNEGLDPSPFVSAAMDWLDSQKKWEAILQQIYHA